MRSPLIPGQPLPVGAEHRRPGPPPVQMEAAAVSGELIIRVQCPVCADNLAEFATTVRKVLAQDNAPKVVTDMNGCPYMDTPGLALWVELKKELQGQGRQLWIQAPSRSVARILNLTKLVRVFPIRPVTAPLGEIRRVWPLDPTQNPEA